jgi:predicted RNA-binding protein with PIN domain
VSSHTVIDGYNLLFRADEDDAGDGPTLQERREAFLRRVDAARTDGDRVTVVFDGAPVRNAAAPATPGLSVRFARSPRSADDLIVSLVRRASGLLAVYCRTIIGAEPPTMRWTFSDLPRASGG